MDIPLWRLDWPRLNRPFCNVYVIAAEGRWPVKIGIAVCAANRLKGLQTSHWKPLEISRTWWCVDSVTARRVEQKAHAILKEERRLLLGEWFDRSVQQAADVVQFAAELEGVEMHEHIPEDVKPTLSALWERMVEKERRESNKEAIRMHERITASNGIDSSWEPVDRSANAA